MIALKVDRSVRYFFLASLARVLWMLARIVPRPVGLSCFGMLGYLVFRLSRRERKRTLDHLQLIYGDAWDRKKIHTVARDVFIGLGKNLFDAFFLWGLSGQRFFELVKSDRLEEFKNAAAKNRGVIIITAHVGCFEMLLHFFARCGFPIIAIGKKAKDTRIDNLLRKMRSGPNIQYMDRSENSRKILRSLREGKLCGVLVDQDTDVEGVFARFMGKPAFTPSGPVRIAMKNEIPVFVVTTIRLQDNTHRVFLSRQVDLANTGNFHNDLVTNVQKINDLLCKTIEQYPSQWVWMHRRWKKQQPLQEHINR